MQPWAYCIVVHVHHDLIGSCGSTRVGHATHTSNPRPMHPSLQDPSPSCLRTHTNYSHPCYILRKARPQTEVCNSCCNYGLLQVLILPESNKDLEPSARLSSQCTRNNQLQGGCSTLHQNDAAPCWFSHHISLLAWFLLVLDFAYFTVN